MGLSVSLLMVHVGMGMISGTLDQSKKIVNESDYEYYVMQKNRDNILEGGHVSDDVFARVVSLGYVKEVDKVIDDWTGVQFGDDDTGCRVIGIDTSSDNLEPWDVIEGDIDDIKEDNKVIADEIIKKYFPDIKVGDTVKASDLEVKIEIVGFCQNSQSFGNAYMWSNFNTAKALTHAVNESTYLGVILKSGYSIKDLENDLEIFEDDIKVMTRQEMNDNIDNYLLNEMGLGQSIGILAILGFFVAMIVISITLYQSVTEKLSELVSLKALGAKKMFINKILIGQTFFITTISFSLATLIAFLISPTLTSVSTLPVIINPFVSFMIYIITLIISIFCTLLPMRKVHKTDPAIIFRA